MGGALETCAGDALWSYSQVEFRRGHGPQYAYHLSIGQ